MQRYSVEESGWTKGLDNYQFAYARTRARARVCVCVYAER